MPTTETKSKIKAPLSEVKSRKLLQLLCEAQTDILDLAAQENLSFAKLAAWLNDTATQVTLDGVCRLSDLRAQLLISRYRTLAAARLFELAKDESGGETARKACVDLLKVNFWAPITETETVDQEGPPAIRAPISIDEIRGYLSALGRCDEAGSVVATSAPVGAIASTTLVSESIQQGESRA